MKNLKLLGLVAAAAMVLMAFAASSASATALYNGTTKLAVGSKLDFSIPSGNSINLVDTSGNSLDKCSTSTVKGELTSNGPTVEGPITETTFGSCTFPITILILGRIRIVWIDTTRGTIVAAAKIEWLIHTVLFGDCNYGFESGATLGTLTTASSGAATFDASAVAKKLGGGATCPETAKWTGSYTSTEPANLRVEKE